ncbi:MAG: ABC transporter permease [Puniceicoccales bacterium]|jgi:phospholipid/cholesterol/gamma-HCH transport system permease protein|nr:ABC transporter permease [Puniceicoccales bacterium]
MSIHPPLLQYRRTGEGSVVTLSVSGDWTLRASLPSWEEVHAYLEAAELPAQGIVELEARALTCWDSAFLSFVRHLRQLCQEQRWQLRPRELPDNVWRILDSIVASHSGAPAAATAPFSLKKALRRIGRPFCEVLDFIGRIYLSFGKCLRGQRVFQWPDFFSHLQQVSVEALPIVALISFLVGLILTFVSLIQLDKFGAGIYVADLVSLAMTREMGCLMTGVILSGRSAAAFAATLGTMRVHEEIDALETFQIPAVDFLVIPRILATVLAMPALCLFADFIGILSGFCVAWGVADIHPLLYLAQTKRALTLSNILIGLLKSAFFGKIIASVGCYYGLRSERDASSVGLASTSAVVASITWIITSDALFAVILSFLDL